MCDKIDAHRFEMQPIVVPVEHLIRVEKCRQSAIAAAESLSDNLHLWQFDLEHHRDYNPDVCSEAERCRAKRFAALRDGTSFLKSRALVRQVLGAYSGIPARQIEIALLKGGKPAMLGCPLSFNISHSGTQLVIAIRSTGLVGVDIQEVKQVQDLLELARSVFDPMEVRFLEGLLHRDRQSNFFRLWVCREAVLKTVGVGFEGRGLALQQDSDENYHVFARPTGWGKIGIAEFAGPLGFLGAIAWSPTAAGLKIHHFLVNYAQDLLGGVDKLAHPQAD